MTEVDEFPIQKSSVDKEQSKINVETPKGSGCAPLISAHYNTEEKGLEKRNECRILHLRNFNNWIKSLLFEDYMSRVNYKFRGEIKALDLCCGKGGDLIKWKKAHIKHLVCCDIAPVALENCRKRYEDMKYRTPYLYSAEFYEIDLTKTLISSKFEDPTIKFHIVSCQFAFHYSFESFDQAECMIKNVTNNLKEGGYFMGTIPDAYELVAKQQNLNSNTFGNEVYKITFDEETVKSYPLFGGRYHFQLNDVVDCPEFLVYFPAFVELCKKYGLKLVEKKTFPEYFDHNRQRGFEHLYRSRALETYNSINTRALFGSASKDYNAAIQYCKTNRNAEVVGTLSESEWEVASLYTVFVFEKVKNPLQ